MERETIYHPSLAGTEYGLEMIMMEGLTQPSPPPTSVIKTTSVVASDQPDGETL